MVLANIERRCHSHRMKTFSTHRIFTFIEYYKDYAWYQGSNEESSNGNLY